MDKVILKARTKEEVIEYIISLLKCIFDPEIPVNIYDLGLIYDIKLEEIDNYTYCTITMTLTSPACPVADTLISQVDYFVRSVPEVDETNIDIVFDPAWNPSKVTKEGRDILELEGTVIPQY